MTSNLLVDARRWLEKNETKSQKPHNPSDELSSSSGRENDTRPDTHTPSKAGPATATEARCNENTSSTTAEEEIEIVYYYQAQTRREHTRFIDSVEARLLEALAPALLSCYRQKDTTREERNILDLGIDAISSLPRDEIKDGKVTLFAVNILDESRVFEKIGQVLEEVEASFKDIDGNLAGLEFIREEAQNGGVQTLNAMSALEVQPNQGEEIVSEGFIILASSASLFCVVLFILSIRARYKSSRRRAFWMLEDDVQDTHDEEEQAPENNLMPLASEERADRSLDRLMFNGKNLMEILPYSEGSGDDVLETAAAAEYDFEPFEQNREKKLIIN
ncbi:hypothetical protein THAOC_03105 [Thalassiosira oceanica]|uniref:Uncharacterized protein n=1 Tax=Thalassiosira oceanica TaxID=159749 RepID=K0TDM5_THAOC|nr:hypothetical protein THAOC_03105 [Thalassiosira oceanica]|eukprot:EJK75184.1 hypothetical protein THAOC_03105 [Thalassiosira oceanica]